MVDAVAVMVFVAVNGYHAVASYVWSRDSEPIEDENYPVVYAQAPGLYECTISTPDIKAKKEFCISCELN